ncbi:MAG: cation:proton antiporter [Eubacteriales bacterium]
MRRQTEAIGMESIWERIGGDAAALLSLALILFSGFLLTRLTKRVKLPNVTGYILAGVLIGPCGLGLISSDTVHAMSFVSDVALSFIAFGVGRFFRRETIRETGWGVVGITLAESFLAGVFVTVGIRVIFRAEWSFCLLLGAIATATAPASTMMTIRQYRARGIFVNMLLQVVTLDDAVCLAAFSVVSALLGADSDGTLRASEVLFPVIWNLAALLLGFLCGFLLCRLITPRRSEDNRLILTVSLLLGISGLCCLFDVSPLLACMVLSAVYINRTGDETLYVQLDRFSPPVLSLFFVVSGMRMELGSFATLGLMGVAYFLIRIVGKYLGAYLGCLAAHAPRGVRNCLGLALIPQAGVAIGLAFLGERILPPETGEMLLTVILSSSVLYELIGPACAKFALFRSGAIRSGEQPAPPSAPLALPAGSGRPHGADGP